ncbi:MAG: hypothetical protein LBR48_09960, partial [Dysgonamonadaceae bacterium]|nr:hypothetical protein [Dysgonamonadaceae bacterium]
MAEKYLTFKNISGQEMDSYFALFDKKAQSQATRVCFLSLGNITVRIENGVPELQPFIEKHFGFCVSFAPRHYDRTLRVWREDVAALMKGNFREAENVILLPKSDDGSRIDISLVNNTIIAFNVGAQTLYYSLRNFSHDLIRIMGHLFVKQITVLGRTESQILAHSAAVGINGKGALLSARGGGGKSTLAVSAMLGGFEYVADDYVFLSKENDKLFACPIYSTINLNPEMFAKMPDLRAEYQWNSYYQPHKHTLDITAHHNSFVKRLEIKVLVFPKITDCQEPSIELMQDGGKAKAQQAYSTAIQVADRHQQPDYIKTLLSFVSGLEVYQINLSADLKKNAE